MTDATAKNSDSPKMDIERSAFEAHFGPYCMSRNNAPGSNYDGYQDSHTNFAWQAWKARAERQ